MKFSLKNKRVLGQLVISTLEQNFRPLPLTFGDLIQPEGQPPFSHPNVNAACQWLSPKPRTAVQLVSVPLLNLKELLTTIAMTVVTYVVVHCSAIRLCPTLRDPMDCSTPGFPLLHYVPEFAQIHAIESVMPNNQLILCCPLSSCSQSFPASKSFPMSHLFASGGQSTGTSALASVLPMAIQGWFLIYISNLLNHF